MKGVEMANRIIVIGLLILFCVYTFAQAKVVVGYEGKWERNPNAYQYCTHVINAFDIPSESNHTNNYFSDAFNITNAMNFTTQVHNSGNNIKAILGIGGENSAKDFFIISKNSVSMNAFINEIVDRVEKGNYDGVDIDWEIIENKHKPYFKEFMKELRYELNRRSHNNPGDYLLTFSAHWNTPQYYSLSEVANYTDFCLLMGYDYNWDHWDNL